MPHVNVETTPFTPIAGAVQSSLITEQCNQIPSELCSGHGNCTIVANVIRQTSSSSLNATASNTDDELNHVCVCESGISLIFSI